MTTKQSDLFGQGLKYPHTPAATRDDTSQQAALSIWELALTLRGQIYQLLRVEGGFTVHEAADQLGETVPAVQPRFSELRAQELIYDSGERRVNHASGKKAIVWKAVRFKECMP